MIPPEKHEQLQALLAELDEKSLEELREQLFGKTDIQKFETVLKLLESMSPAFRAEARGAIPRPGTEPIGPPEDLPAPSKILGLDGKPINQPKVIERAAANADPALGLLQVTVQGNGVHVQIEFDRMLKTISLPVAQGFQLACLLMESCGAKIDKAVIPGTPQAPGPA